MKNLLMALAIIGLCVAAYFVIGSYYLDTETTHVEEKENENKKPNIPAENEETDLTGSSWSWQYTDLAGGERVSAPAGDHFVLAFEAGGKVGSRTDCNSMGGVYSLDGEVLSMGQFMMTQMYCEGSKEMLYAEHLGLVNSYVIEGDTLRFNLNRDYGTMVFMRHN